MGSRSRHSPRLPATVLLAGCAAFIIGAALYTARTNHRPVAAAFGRITFDGEPLRLGSILFVPTEPGPTAQANLTSDGQYVLTTYEPGDGAVIGNHRIMVISLAEDGQNRPEGSVELPVVSESGDPIPLISVIPERYGDDKTSGLTATVVAGDNRFDFALTSEALPGADEGRSPSKPAEESASRAREAR
ncbi:MAG TPA: hypothetical protein VM452_18345 [Caulifigura sp.]|jgi:hypothetical protein|nr:hypothetical protein [Caulifigura sp.]